MRPYVQIQLTAGTICAMSDEQFHALRDNVLAEGLWENVEGPLRIDGGDYLGVYLPNIFVGIEKDGYTHS